MMALWTKVVARTQQNKNFRSAMIATVDHITPMMDVNVRAFPLLDALLMAQMKRCLMALPLASSSLPYCLWHVELSSAHLTEINGLLSLLPVKFDILGRPLRFRQMV